MRIGNNIRLRKDGRYEARYIKKRDASGKIIYGYCYGHTYEEAQAKRTAITQPESPIRELNLLICSEDNLCKEVLEMAEEMRLFRKIDFYDIKETNTNAEERENMFEQYLGEYAVALPAVEDSEMRIQWMQILTKAGFLIPTLIHPSAVVSRSAEVGAGSIVCARTIIGAGAVIGKGCVISSGAIVDKNAVLPDWTNVACGELVSAACEV